MDPAYAGTGSTLLSGCHGTCIVTAEPKSWSWAPGSPWCLGKGLCTHGGGGREAAKAADSPARPTGKCHRLQLCLGDCTWQTTLPHHQGSRKHCSNAVNHGWCCGCGSLLFVSFVCLFSPPSFYNCKKSVTWLFSMSLPSSLWEKQNQNAFWSQKQQHYLGCSETSKAKRKKKSS